MKLTTKVLTFSSLVVLVISGVQAAPDVEKFSEFSPDATKQFFMGSGSKDGPFELNAPTWLDELERIGCNLGFQMCWQEEVEVTTFRCAPDPSFDPSQCLGLPPFERDLCLMRGRNAWVGLSCPSREVRSWSFDRETCEYTYTVLFRETEIQCQPVAQSDIGFDCRNTGGTPPPPQEVVLNDWPVACR